MHPVLYIEILHMKNSRGQGAQKMISWLFLLIQRNFCAHSILWWPHISCCTPILLLYAEVCLLQKLHKRERSSPLHTELILCFWFSPAVEQQWFWPIPKSTLFIALLKHWSFRTAMLALNGVGWTQVQFPFFHDSHWITFGQSMSFILTDFTRLLWR